MATAFERIVRLHPAYDKRDPDPHKDYGIHGVDLLFVLKGPVAAMQFMVYTGWHLPHVQAELDAKVFDGTRRFPLDSHHPMPADVGYHALVPQYEGQKSMLSECDWLDGKPCYYDDSTLMARDLFDVLLREGDEGVWRELEKRYHTLKLPEGLCDCPSQPGWASA